MRLLQLLLLLLVGVLQLPATQVQHADAHFTEADTSAQSCTPDTYWVNCGGYCGVGSQSDPFCSISSALEAAQGASCGAIVQVENSWCAEDLSISQDTAIVGQGSLTTIEGTITNDSGASLRLEDLAVYGTGAEAALSIVGDGAITVIESVTIESATGFGIRQSGGMLNASSLMVVGTAARTAGSVSGAAICLEGGTRATLDRVQLFDNEVTGLLVSGDTTWAVLGDLLIDDTIQSLRVPGFVALHNAPDVEVRDGGLLTAAWHP